MAISRRTFIKVWGGGVTGMGLTEVIFKRTGWAAAVGPAKIKDADTITSICPFCGVGCGLIAHTKGGKLVKVEGDPDHPINQEALCSKGQAVWRWSPAPGDIKGMLVWGMNPAVGSSNLNQTYAALDKLEWLAAFDLWETDTSVFWKRPGVSALG